jgi:hypothetical protein
VIALCPACSTCTDCGARELPPERRKLWITYGVGLETLCIPCWARRCGAIAQARVERRTLPPEGT